jgi:hypothetical protein
MPLQNCAQQRKARGSARECGAGGGIRTLTGLPPTDFRTSYGFRRRQALSCKTWRLWSGLSLHPSGFALGAARLVSTPSRFRAWLGIAIAGFPDFEQFCTAGFPAGTQAFKSVASTVPPRPRTSIYILDTPRTPISRAAVLIPQRHTTRRHGGCRSSRTRRVIRISPCRCGPRPRPRSCRSGRSRGHPFRRTCSAPGRSRALNRPPGTRPNAGCRARAR